MPSLILMLYIIVFDLKETPKMSNLRDYYERALQEFGTADEGESRLKNQQKYC